MLNSASHDRLEKSVKLSNIISSVQLELEALERRLAESVSSTNPFLDKISKYIIQAGGKRLRPAVSFLFAKALNKGYLSSNHFQLGLALELIHTATLIHDDILDEADKRRGSETINKKWSDKAAVIAGDYLLARSLTRLASTKSTSVIEIFANIMDEICVGEIQQSYQNNEFTSLEQYIEKSRRKTAMLFIAGTESAAILTPNVNNLIINSAREYALNFGIAFQIIDDILNFTAKESELGKPVGADLKNGIITAPVIFALEEYEKINDSTLKQLIQNNFKDDKDFDLALKLIYQSNGIQKAKDLAYSYSKLAMDSLSPITESPFKKALIDLSRYVIERHF